MENRGRGDPPAGGVLRGQPAGADPPGRRTGGLHVVQIGSDDSVFEPAAPSDTRRRQRLYGQLLAERRPGSQLTYLVLTKRTGATAFQDGNVTFQPVPGVGPQRWRQLWAALLELRRRQPPAVVATQTIFTDAWLALLAGWPGSFPVVGQIHFDLYAPAALAENLGPGRGARWRLALALRLLGRLAAVRVVGRRLEARLRAEGRSRQIHVLPVPVTLTMPVTTAAAPRRPCVLFVGRLVPAKNLAAWLRVAARVRAAAPEVEFEWAGDGPLRDTLGAEAERLGLRTGFRLRGAVPHDALPALYQNAAVFLLTSHYEGFGRVAVEAGLAEVPVVAPQLTGVEDIVVSGETGFLHALGDEAGLAASVVWLLQHPAQRAQMGRAARERVRQLYDPQRLADAWVSLLISAAEGTLT